MENYEDWGVRELISELERRDSQEKHNGWSNYATWRIRLEIWDGYDWSDFENNFDDIGTLAEYLKDSTEQIIIDSNGTTEKSLAIDYARAFINNVNWYEIAEHIIEENPNIIIND